MIIMREERHRIANKISFCVREELYLQYRVGPVKDSNLKTQTKVFCRVSTNDHQVLKEI